MYVEASNGVSTSVSEPIEMKIERPIGRVKIELVKEEFVIVGQPVSDRTHHNYVVRVKVL